MTLRSMLAVTIATALTAATVATVNMSEPVKADQTSVASHGGYIVGELYSFERKNAIDLESDRGNLKTSQYFDLPPGFVIESTELVVTKKKYTVTYGVSHYQANSVLIDQRAVISLEESLEKARGFFDGKKRVEAIASLSKENNFLKYASVLNAGSHARVSWHGWADGRKYSSRDGVIRADLKVTARYTGTAAEIEKSLINLAQTVGKSSAETISEYAKQFSKQIPPQNNATAIAKPTAKDKGNKTDAPDHKLVGDTIGSEGAAS